MNRTSCSYETAVSAAARSGEWSEELLAHREECLVCAQLTLVVAALHADAGALNADPRPLPLAEAIWLRARLDGRRRKFELATRPIVWMQRLALIVAGGAGLTFAPKLWGLVRGMISTADPLAGSLPRTAGSPLLVLIISALVLGGLFVWELTMPQEG
jgi:hypothetical protein